MADDISVTVGKLEVQVQTLEKDMQELKADIKAIRQSLDKANGGLMMLMLVGSVCATIGALVSKFIQWKF